MKPVKLTKEEKGIEKAFREGKLIRVKNFEKEKKKLIQIAKNTKRRLNLTQN